MNKPIVAILFLFSVFVLSCTQKKCEVSLNYFNDAHEISPVNDEYGERGGVARLKTVIDNIKTNHSASITIFGGDLAGGSLFGSVYHGTPMVEAFNLIGLDYANFGQHDFDFGANHTQDLVKKSDFQWFSSNLMDKNGNTFASLPSFILQDINGIKIGLIGLTDAMNTTTPDAEVVQYNLLKAAKDAVLELSNRHSDLIVAVTQTGFETNKLLLDSIPQIDAIFTEEVSESVSEVKYLGKRPVIAVCGNMGSVAQLIAQKTKEGMQLFVQIHKVDSSIPENAEMKVLQSRYQDELNSSLNRVIGNSPVDLDAGISGDFRCRWSESNLGNLITDAYRNYFHTDLAVINGGGIRANIPAGNITERNIRAVLPFGNTIVKIKMSGAELRNLLEQSVSEVEKKSGRFLQISGGSYTYNPEKEPGNRIIKLEVGNESINLDKTYTLALPEFILKGGDGFKIHGQLNNENEKQEDVTVLRNYILGKRSVKCVPEDRIKIIKN